MEPKFKDTRVLRRREALLTLRVRRVELFCFPPGEMADVWPLNRVPENLSTRQFCLRSNNAYTYTFVHSSVVDGSLGHPLLLAEGVAALDEIVLFEPFLEWQLRAVAGAEEAV